MSKFEYTEDMVARMNDVAASGVTEDIIESLVDEFEFPRRSVTAKLRKLGYDVPKKPGAAPVFSADETEALAKFLEDNSGVHTADEIAATFADGQFQAPIHVAIAHHPWPQDRTATSELLALPLFWLH